MAQARIVIESDNDFSVPGRTHLCSSSPHTSSSIVHHPMPEIIIHTGMQQRAVSNKNTLVAGPVNPPTLHEAALDLTDINGRVERCAQVHQNIRAEHVPVASQDVNLSVATEFDA